MPADATELDRSRKEREVLEALVTRPGATAGYIAASIRRRMRPVHRILEALAEQGAVERVPLPTGHVGYRRRDTDPPRRKPDAKRAPHSPGPAESGDADRTPPPTSPPDLSGLEVVVGFFKTAGITAAVTSTGHLRVGAVAEKPPSAAMRDADARRRWLESFVAAHLGDELLRAVETHLSTRTDTRVVSEHGDVIIFDRRARRLGVITAARVRLGARDQPFDGNFLADGPHWEPVNEALEAATRAQTGEPVSPAGLHRDFPEGSDDELRSAALDATRRLRHDRARVFAHDVRVDIGDVSLVLSPLAVDVRPLELPFIFERNDRKQFAGAIQLTLTHEPLRCMWHQGSDPETLALAWAMSLAVYADLTCPPAELTAALRDAGATSRSRSSSHKRRDRDRTRAAPRTDPAVLPSAFRPLGATARIMASYVAGHRRRLQPDHEHSADAVANAAAVGIRLRAHETWVQPHTRGVPPDTLLHFAWVGPDWARRLTG